MMIGHITPWLYVGTPDWDVPDDSLTGEPQELGEQILAGTADGVNQIQVRFRARSCDELCDQMAAFATDVAPLAHQSLTHQARNRRQQTSLYLVC